MIRMPGQPHSLPLRRVDEHWDRVAGRRVLVRVDLNLPLGPDHAILCDYRLRRIVGFVRRLKTFGCRVTLLSHLGQPDGRPDPELSLARFAQPLQQLLDHPVRFLQGVSKTDQQLVQMAPPGSVFLMENLRFHPGEQSASPAFARSLANMGDVFVNDAFSVSHRPHASVVLLPELMESYAGPSFLDEYRRAAELVQYLRPPVVILSGGRKLDKLEVYRRFMPRVDALLLGSGFVEPLREAKSLNPLTQARIVMPPDVVTEAQDGRLEVAAVAGLPERARIIDLGPDAVALYTQRIRSAGTVIVNGSVSALPPDHPLSGMTPLMRAVVQSRALKVVCGGTGCSLFIRAGYATRVDYIFPGGGALLTFLESQSNPGLMKLVQRPRAGQRSAVAATTFEAGSAAADSGADRGAGGEGGV